MLPDEVAMRHEERSQLGRQAVDRPPRQKPMDVQSPCVERDGDDGEQNPDGESSTLAHGDLSKNEPAATC